MTMNGINMGGGRNRSIRCYIFNFKGIGIKMAGQSGDCKIVDCLVNEWLNGDNEFTIEEEYTATGIFVNRADCFITGGTISRWTKIPLHLGPECATLTVDGGTHLYNGGSGRIDKNNPINILADAGAGAMFIGCYLDNGRCELYSPNIQFHSCRALQNTGNSTLTYFIGLYANGNSGPYQFRADGWQVVSQSLTDGTVPFYKFLPNGGNTWAGNYSNFEQSSGYKETVETLRVSRLQTDNGLNVVYYAPGNGGASGAGVGLVSQSTPISVRDDPPSIRESGGGIYLYRAKRGVRRMTATDFVNVNDAGKEIIFANPLAMQAIFPETAYEGWFCYVTVSGDSSAAITLKSKDSVPASTCFEYGNTDGIIKIQGRGMAREVVCIRNNDGDSAEFIVRGGAGGTIISPQDPGVGDYIIID